MERQDETRPAPYRERSMFRDGGPVRDTRGLDVAALVVTVLLIWGPLAAGALRHMG